MLCAARSWGVCMKSIKLGGARNKEVCVCGDAGHYVIKSSEHWLLLDDELVDVVNESHVQQAFGSKQEYTSDADRGYILLYERR